MAHETKPDRIEEIGFHKGAFSTLAKEREDLKRRIGLIEQLMHLHIKHLKSLGVDLEKKQDTPPKND